jgi:DNA-binding protein YbaB
MHYTEIEATKVWLKEEFVKAIKEAFKDALREVEEEKSKKEKAKKSS